MINKISGIIAALYLVLGCITASVSYAVSPADVIDSSEIQSMINEFLEEVPGLAVSAVCGNDSYCKAFGFDNIKDSTLISENSNVEIASISKEFTALSVLLLQEEGKLSIDDSVSDYLPWFNVSYHGEKADIKIWHLLNHCSGLPNVDKLFPIGNDDSLKEKTARLVEGAELVFEPGEQFFYNNVGYDILTCITESTSGESFEEYVTEEILEPIGMVNSGFDIPTIQGYRYFYGSLQPYDAPRIKGNVGAGYLIVSPEDMVCWINAQLGKIDLPEKLTNAIEFSHTITEEHKIKAYDTSSENAEETLYYANGWFQNADGTIFEHSGSNPNFNSMIKINRNKNVGLFTVLNCQEPYSDDIHFKIYSELCGDDSVIIDSFEYMTNDKIGIYWTITGIVVFALILISAITQKKRITKKVPKMKSEVFRLIARLLILSLLLAVFAALPNLIGYSYKMAFLWMPLSIMIALFLTDFNIIAMIILSIKRFTIKKKQALNDEYI